MLTFEDVWKMFQETDRKFQETDRKFQETDRKFQETDRKFQETSLQFKEQAKETSLQVKEQAKETNRQVKEQAKETNRQFKEQAKETDRQFKEQAKETDRQFRETDRKIKEVSVQIGKLGGRLGEFVEGLVAPACKTLFIQRGIPVHKVSRRVEADLPGDRHIEIDLFVVNTDTVSLIEVKSKLTAEDVRDHLTRMSEFKEFFPEYADKRAIGAVAGMVVEENVIRFAIRSGLFVIVQAGDSVVIANDQAFVPCAW